MKTNIPVHEDVLSLKTLLDSGFTMDQMLRYYQDKGYRLSLSTLRNRLMELR